MCSQGKPRYDSTNDPIIPFIFSTQQPQLLLPPVTNYCGFLFAATRAVSLPNPLQFISLSTLYNSTHFPLHSSPPHFPLHISCLHTSPSIPHLLVQSHQRIQLVPLCNYSPNVSSDEYGLSDNEHPEHLYSLGKFVAVTPHRRGLIPSPSSGSPTPQRRGTQSATTTDPKWIPPSVQQDSRDACSSPDVKRKKDRNHHPVKTKRSKTFQASSSSQAEFQRNVSGLMEESEQAVMVTTSETSETSLKAAHGSHDNYTELL